MTHLPRPAASANGRTNPASSRRVRRRRQAFCSSRKQETREPRPIGRRGPAVVTSISINPSRAGANPSGVTQAHLPIPSNFLLVAFLVRISNPPAPCASLRSRSARRHRIRSQRGRHGGDAAGAAAAAAAAVGARVSSVRPGALHAAAARLLAGPRRRAGHAQPGLGARPRDGAPQHATRPARLLLAAAPRGRALPRHPGLAPPRAFRRLGGLLLVLLRHCRHHGLPPHLVGAALPQRRCHASRGPRFCATTAPGGRPRQPLCTVLRKQGTASRPDAAMIALPSPTPQLWCVQISTAPFGSDHKSIPVHGCKACLHLHTHSQGSES